MKKVLIIINTVKEESLALSKQISAFLKSKGVECDSLDFDGFNENTPFGEYEFVITLGGDGTVLFAARNCVQYDVPVFPVNLGQFGFMASVQTSEWQESLELLLQGKAPFQYRSMIKATLVRDGQKEAEYFFHGFNKLIRVFYIIEGLEGLFEALEIAFGQVESSLEIVVDVAGRHLAIVVLSLADGTDEGSVGVEIAAKLDDLAVVVVTGKPEQWMAVFVIEVFFQSLKAADVVVTAHDDEFITQGIGLHIILYLSIVELHLVGGHARTGPVLLTGDGGVVDGWDSIPLILFIDGDFFQTCGITVAGELHPFLYIFVGFLSCHRHRDADQKQQDNDDLLFHVDCFLMIDGTKIKKNPEKSLPLLSDISNKLSTL